MPARIDTATSKTKEASSERKSSLLGV